VTEPAEDRSDVVLRLAGVGVTVDGTTILRDADWTVRRRERWVVLGPNGAGKTTLLRLAALYLHPSTGTVEVLGHRLGQVDVRSLRTRIGLVSPAFAGMLRDQVSAVEVVMSAREAALETWWHEYGDADRKAALALLDRMGVADLADRAFGALSSGERQRVLLARSLWGEPGLVLYDEPSAGLDLGAREDLLARMATLAHDPDMPPIVLVTHHVEEIPAGFTHALLVGDSRIAAAGPIDQVLTSEGLSQVFALPLELDRRNCRFAARAVTPSTEASDSDNVSD
jgi:iron complex transport system ATP-binding protein